MYEVWKQVEGFEGYYEVSNKGHIRSVDRIIEYKTKDGGICRKLFKGHQLKPTLHNNDKLVVVLSRDNERTGKALHLLVYDTFIGIPEGHVITFKDDDIFNCALDNLEPVTLSEYRTNKHINRGKTYGNKLTVEDFKNIKQLYENGYKQSELSKMFNVSQGHISNIISGKVIMARDI